MNSLPTTEPPPTPVESIFGSAIRASQEAVVIVDDQQRIVFFNPAAERMFECAEASALGSELSRFIPERHRQAHAEHVRGFDAPGPAERPMRSRSTIHGLRTNGEEFPAQAMITRVDVPCETGPKRYFTALIHDLSSEHVLKAEIDSVTERMRSVFELAPVAIWITEGDSIVYANAICARLFAAPDQLELVGTSIFALLHLGSHPEVRRKMTAVRELNTPVSLVHEQIVRLDGSHCDVDIAMAALPCRDRQVLQMVITDISQRTQERLALERSREELQRLSASLVEAREAERRHIAREMHDELGQRLTTLKMELASLEKRFPDDQRERLSAMLEMVDDTVVSVRRIAADLRPMMLDDLGLCAALEWLASESGRRLGIEISLDFNDELVSSSDPLAIAIYRIVQEALTNVARHAHASRVQVTGRRSGDHLVLTVQDNGIGLQGPPFHKAGSLGLIGIRERVSQFQGDLAIDNLPSGGCRLVVKLPLGPMTRAPKTKPVGGPPSVTTRNATRGQGCSDEALDVATLTHELHVHQLELEMQNEELQRTQVDLVAARDRYLDLYDFSPVGYFTLDRAGLVTEANLTGAALLGRNRASLIGQGFTRSIAAADRDRWQQHLNSAFQSDSPGRIELMLLCAESRPFDGQIDTLRMMRGEGEASMRIALTDITERRRAEMDRRIAITTVSANEAARLRLARELHDEIGQQLSALKMELSGLQLSNASATADHRIAEMKTSIDDSLATVRRITTELRPLLLDDLGLDAALEWLASESARESGLPVTVSLDDSGTELDDAQALGLFRLAQAALKDVLNHTRGQGVHIELQRRGGVVVLVVEAQGSGWPAAPLVSLPDSDQTLQQQAHMLGGELIIDTGPGASRKVTFRMPTA